MWRHVDGGTPVRCELCGEQIGKAFGDAELLGPRPDVVLRCFACAAAEEADAITAQAVASNQNEQGA